MINVIIFLNLIMIAYAIVFAIKSLITIKKFRNEIAKKENIKNKNEKIESENARIENKKSGIIKSKIAKNEEIKVENNVNNEKNIVIMIPVYKEQSTIVETVEYFSRITKQQYPIIIITTKKERNENKNDPTTQEIIKERGIEEIKNVFVVEYPSDTGYMADQLNYAIENIEKILNRKIQKEDWYLALYNADSRPNEKTFELAAQQLSDKCPVIQQYSYCFENYSKLSTLMKGFAIYQSNFELKTGIINTTCSSKFLYTHVVGHGLFINFKTLENLNNFNTEFWCEDIYLGLQLKFNNIKIKPLYVLENMENADTLKILIKQNAVWFKTTSQFGKIYKDIVRKKNYKSKFNGLIGTINEMRCAINWLMFPILMLLMILVPVLYKRYDIAMMSLISYEFYILINYIFTLKLINKIDDKKYRISLGGFCGYSVATLLSNLGPLKSVFSQDKEKYKTERKPNNNS